MEQDQNKNPYEKVDWVLLESFDGDIGIYPRDWDRPGQDCIATLDQIDIRHARFIVKACNERQGLIERVKALEIALEQWGLVDTESVDKNPSPDLNLRFAYRRQARVLTVEALALAKTGE